VEDGAFDLPRCFVELPPHEVVPFSIIAHPDIAQTAGGIAGAEFGIRGVSVQLGTELILVLHPNPAASIVIGNPFSGGVNIGFDECQVPDANGSVLLFTVEAVNVGMTGNGSLQTDKKDHPSDLNFSCPLVNSCDPPFYTPRCTSWVGNMGLIVPSVSVESSSWGVVKQIYR